jgi:hypothetical protein
VINFLISIIRDLIIVSMTKGPPVLLNWKTNESFTLDVKPFQHTVKKRVDYNYGVFSHDGRYIFVGNSIGIISVFRTEDRRKIAQFHITSETFQLSEDESDIESNIVDIDDLSARLKRGDYGVKQIVFSDNSNFMLVNCENCMRLFCETTDVINTACRKSQFIFQMDFTDPIDNKRFNTCGISGCNSRGVDAEFVIATNSDDIHIWNRLTGRRVKQLESARERNHFATWHPNRPIIVSCTDAGSVFIWSKVLEDNWAAFSPNFIEVPDNEFYVEREDEFDESSEVAEEQQIVIIEEDADIDIVSLTSDQMRMEKEFILPTIPVPDKQMNQYHSQLNRNQAIQAQTTSMNMRSPPKRKTGTTPRTKRRSRKRKRVDCDSENDE